MSLTEPFPLSTNILPTIKSTLGIESDVEAWQLSSFRRFLDCTSTRAPLSDVEREDREIVHGGVKANVSILRPHGSKDEVLPVLLFMHGGGWVLGNLYTHAILTSQLVNQLHACLVFVDYSLSPEVKYPVALEECYAVLCWIQENAASIHVNAKHLAVIGDSVGGHFATTLSILAKERGNTGISYQVMFYPVICPDFESESYIEHKDNSVLPREAMKFYWDAFLSKEEEKALPTVVPISASLDRLKDLPPALIITAENDVLRSEGELYAKKLTKAGVHTICVRYFGVEHAFASSAVTRQCLAAIAQTADVLKKHFEI